MPLITFDLDGALQRNPFRTGVMPHVRRLLIHSPGLAHLDSAAADRELDLRLRAEFRRRQEAGMWVDCYNWDDIVATVGAGAGYTGPPIVLAPLVRHYAVPDHIHAFPGAHRCLQALRSAGHTLVALTNGFAAYQEPVLAALDLLPFFAALLTPDRTGTSKPWPEHFHLAGAPPALHIGDTLVHDVYGASLAGYTSVWIPPDVPAALRALPPWERADHPEAVAFQEHRAGAEAVWHPNPRINARSLRPDYIAAHLDEVPDIAEHWCLKLGFLP